MYHTCIGIISLLSICCHVNVFAKADATEDPKSLGRPEDLVFRVVNGKPATLGQFPYQIALRLPSRRRDGTYQTFCGGAILRVSKILTAAHCLCDERRGFCDVLCGSSCRKKPLLNMYAVAGSIATDELYNSNKNTQWRALKRTHIPDGYRFPRRDIAIAITSAPFEFNNNTVGPLPYATRDMDYRSKKCTVSGYGRLSNEVRSDTLQWAILDLIPIRECNRLHRKQMRQFICTRSITTNVLQGDSGGPLVCHKTGDPADKGKGVIVGVVSGARDRSGTFFTRVSSFKEFIKNKASPYGVSSVVVISVLASSWCILDLRYLLQV